MDIEEAVVGVFPHKDGILLVGSSIDVQALAERFDPRSKNTAQLAPNLLLAAGAAFHGLSVTQEQSGRWRKLIAESAETLQQAGITAWTKDDLLAGVAHVGQRDRSCRTCGSSRSPSLLGPHPWSWRQQPRPWRFARPSRT